jgi:hypothetical protein
MSDIIYIEEYSPKSFVVRGSTKDYKDSLLALGGKWNSSLTDKKSGDKFGAWLFWGDKQKEISEWIEKGCKVVTKSSQPEKTQGTPNSNSVLEAKIDALTKMVESLCRYHKIEYSDKKRVKPPLLLDSDVESDEDVPPVKPKRLLGK